MPFRSRNRCEAFDPARRRTLGAIACLPWLNAGCERPADRPAAPLEGRALPPIVLPDMAGKPQAVAETPGFPLLLNFWATWCHPCRAEMAGLERIHRRLAGRGLRLVGISLDEDLNLVREYLLQSGLGFPVLSDPKGRFSVPLLGSFAVPATLLVGRDGVVRRQVLGERRWDEAPASDWVGELLV